MKTFCCAVVLSLVTVGELCADKPNFIFVLSDDIAQGDLGCYGQKLIQTPRLDQMAAEGTRYLQAYCGTSVCAPSRSSFFTGLHCGHCPVRGNYEVHPKDNCLCPMQPSPSPKLPNQQAIRQQRSANGEWVSLTVLADHKIKVSIISLGTTANDMRTLTFRLTFSTIRSLSYCQETTAAPLERLMLKS